MGWVCNSHSAQLRVPLRMGFGGASLDTGEADDMLCSLWSIGKMEIGSGEIEGVRARK